MTPASPRFTVLLPTHNRADVVGFAIASASPRRWPISSCSSLATAARIRRPQSSLALTISGCAGSTCPKPRTRLREPQPGHARGARRAGAFMAHDDLWLPDHLERFGPLFDLPEVDWAYSRPAWVANDGIVVPFAIDLHDPDAFAVWMTDHNSVPAGNVVYRRSAHKWAGPWPEATTRGGDWELWRKIVGPSQGANLAYHPEVTQLHFRADWRTEGAWGPVPLGDWLDLAGSSWWPKAAAHISAGRTRPSGCVRRAGPTWQPVGGADALRRASLARRARVAPSRAAGRVSEAAGEAGQRLANVTERKQIAEPPGPARFDV